MRIHIRDEDLKQFLLKYNHSEDGFELDGQADLLASFVT